jgi:hypothetical protein
MRRIVRTGPPKYADAELLTTIQLAVSAHGLPGVESALARVRLDLDRYTDRDALDLPLHGGRAILVKTPEGTQ